MCKHSATLLPPFHRGALPSLRAARYSRSNTREVLVIAVVWQFEVREGREDEFERFYGADGPWTAISRRSRSFLLLLFPRPQMRMSRPSLKLIIDAAARVAIRVRC